MSTRRVVNQLVYDTKVNPQNKEWLKEFLIAINAEGKASKTINQYHSDLKILFYFIYEHFDNRLVTQLKKKDLTRLLVLQKDREGKQIHINPHCFRHSRLENLYRVHGVPIEKLRSLANHKDISTTASYLAEKQESDIAEIFGMDASAFVS